jgi:hypothetical protein
LLTGEVWSFIGHQEEIDDKIEKEIASVGRLRETSDDHITGFSVYCLPDTTDNINKPPPSNSSVTEP